MSSTDAMIVLTSSDGVVFEVEKAVAAKSQTLKRIIEDTGDKKPIPVPNVNSKILDKVIAYCTFHVEAEAKVWGECSAAAMEEFDADFVKVDPGVLSDIMQAANYLEIKCLLELTCRTVANIIKGKSPEEIRTALNIENDFTPEEEEKVRKQTEWAFM